jgi:hypothetical protein
MIENAFKLIRSLLCHCFWRTRPQASTPMGEQSRRYVHAISWWGKLQLRSQLTGAHNISVNEPKIRTDGFWNFSMAESLSLTVDIRLAVHEAVHAGLWQSGCDHVVIKAHIRFSVKESPRNKGKRIARIDTISLAAIGHKGRKARTMDYERADYGTTRLQDYGLQDYGLRDDGNSRHSRTRPRAGSRPFHPFW